MFVLNIYVYKIEKGKYDFEISIRIEQYMKKMNVVKMLPAREQVVKILRESILTFEIGEGTSLKLNELAVQLGVSITPVREALQILEREELVRLNPHKEAIVVGINEKYIQDYYVTRAILESEAVAMVCEPGKDLTIIKSELIKQQTIISEEQYFAYSDANYDFHEALWTIADNMRIKNILKSLFITNSIGKTSNVEENAKISFEEHRVIFNAILDKDTKTAKEAMYQHLMRSMKDNLSKIK